MDELLLNQLTRSQINQFLEQPVHNLIIDGQEGSGKASISTYIAANLLQIDAKRLSTATFINILPVNGSISINEIRSIQNFMKLKTMGTQAIRRVVLVSEAEKLTLEAQNAFLKILEEPPIDSLIILQTSNIKTLLPTIRSRAQLITIKAVTKEQISDYFMNKGFEQENVERAYYISDGRLGLMYQLLTNGKNELVSSINEAKIIIAMSVYDRLLLINNYKQKDDVANMFSAIESICHGAVNKISSTDDSLQLKRWHSSLKLVLKSQEHLKSNANIKLLLTNLFINL